MDAKDDVAADWRGGACYGIGWSGGVETVAIKAMMCTPIAPDATPLWGRGFLYERENHYGNQKGGKEVHEEILDEGEQLEEVEFVA